MNAERPTSQSFRLGDWQATAPLSQRYSGSSTRYFELSKQTVRSPSRIRCLTPCPVKSDRWRLSGLSYYSFAAARTQWRFESQNPRGTANNPKVRRVTSQPRAKKQARLVG